SRLLKKFEAAFCSVFSNVAAKLYSYLYAVALMSHI
ncbi:unnamed protein product, partial [marine sediment metagenome]